MKHYLNVCNVNGGEIAPYPIAVTRARFADATMRELWERVAV